MYNHAGTKVIIIHSEFHAIPENIRDKLENVQKVVIIDGDEDAVATELKGDVADEQLLQSGSAAYAFADIDEDAKAWQDEPWNDVEVLSGKVMQPGRDKKKTILFGKCMYQANKDNANIREMIPIRGCPPKPDQIVKAFQQAGIDVGPEILKN
ncbi:MAG: hypothetical protein PVI71_19100, partial [Desulfobacterales bacterium]